MIQKPILYCNIIGHEQKEIQGVCINEECNKPRAVCFQCMRDIHSSHCNNLIDFTEFEKLKQETFEIAKQVKQLINQMEQSIKIMTEISKDFRFDQGQYNCTLHEIEALVKLYFKMQPIGQLFQTKMQVISDFLTQVKTINQNKKQILQQSAIQPRQQQQINLSANSQSEIKTLPKAKIVILNNVKFHFSEEHKSEKIKVSQSGLQAESTEYIERIILCNEVIPKNGITRVIFKILKHDSNISIGVCIKEQITNYKPDLNKIGHGQILQQFSAYLFNDAGLLCSHEWQSKKEVKEFFRYEVNHEILLEVNMNTKCISWIKRKTDQAITMEFNTDKDLFPCVFLAKSIIQIINEL